MLQRKGAYFYVIDAFVASIIIFGALVIFFGHFVNSSSSKQAYYTATDFLSALSSTEIRSYDDPTIRGWVANGAVTDPHESLLEQLARFTVIGQTANATTLARIVASRTPDNIGLEMLVNGQQLYIRQPIPEANANSLLSAKRIVLLRQSTTTLYPPVIVEVRTWQ